MTTTPNKEPNVSTITISTTGITIPLSMLGQLDAPSRLALADALCWDEVEQEARRRLAGESDSWSAGEARGREDWLRLIGAVHTDDVQAAERRQRVAEERLRQIEVKLDALGAEVLRHLREDNVAIRPCCVAALTDLAVFAWSQP